MKVNKVIISGGGTGGHIFPALSIADELKRRNPEVQILFVGAKGRMEEEKVPAAGYDIVTVDVKGLDRKHLWNNISTLYKLLKGMGTVRALIRDFKPDIVIGVGGYVSAPTLLMASLLGIPTLVQEQNSYAGVTNKLVGKRANRICVAYKGMERFFPANKIVLTGNPIRQNLLDMPRKAREAYDYFGLDPELRTLVIVGGSLGAGTINASVVAALHRLVSEEGLQVLWQTGKGYFERAQQAVAQLGAASSRIVVKDFIYRMDYAFSITDLLISRAGAGSISEFCLLGLPVILVPSPNVSEDHQTKNAMALVNEGAALIVRDSEASQRLIDTALDTLAHPARLDELSVNIRKLGLPDSAKRIVDEVEHIVTIAMLTKHTIIT